MSSLSALAALTVPNPLYGLSGLSSQFLPYSLPSPSKWSFVDRRFASFLANIEPTVLQQDDVQTKAGGIVSKLNGHYWGAALTPGCTSCVLTGSWGKGTRIRQHSDLDLIFLLPWAEYRRFEQRAGNKQSGLLQEVKNVLLPSYPQTDIKGDGPTVVVNFSSYKIEVVPCFRHAETHYVDLKPFKVWVCDTNNDGCYKLAAPYAECSRIWEMNAASNGDLISLIRMAKVWKAYCNVEIKSLVLEQIALDFMSQYSLKGKHWHDWMVRDFFLYMPLLKNGMSLLPVSSQPIFYGDQWISKAETAARNAAFACQCEEADMNGQAGESWQKIFGYEIPKEK